MMMWTLFIRTLFTYVFVFAALRIMGKREIGKLSVFDLVVSIMIAEISALALQDLKIPVWHGAFIIGLLVLMQIGVSILTLHSRRLHDLVEGKPTVLIANGEVNDSEMKRTRYSMSDLLMQLREKDITSIADVEFAILETTGKLSVFPKAGQRPITADDLGMVVKPTVMPTSLIVGGEIIFDKLAAIGKSPQWLKEQLTALGYSSEKEVFYAWWDGTTLKVDRLDNKSKVQKQDPPL
ncbi:DUF421 domain-containing protein [Sulfoacidibacillus thermotolerans]|nr:DUF421 domain-containing protein [Sulfoacidibacillus thermotolerans]